MHQLFKKTGFGLFGSTILLALLSCASQPVPLSGAPVQVDMLEGRKPVVAIAEIKPTGNRYALCADCPTRTVKTLLVLDAPPPAVPVILPKPVTMPTITTPVPSPTVASSVTIESNVVDAAPLKLKLESSLRVQVYFEYNSALLGVYSRQVLDGLAKKVKENDDVFVIGTADATGNAKKNAKLSRQRAVAVEKYLITQGIDKIQIKIAADHLYYIADNSSEQGRAKNRRAEILITTQE
jgi:outer membrane protein OmpA-like peptidoglycan-associated protein